MNRETYIRSVLESVFSGYKEELIDNAVEMIARYIPFDAVEVVRCRECRYYHEDDYGYCSAWGDMFHHWEGYDRVDPDGYCHMGKRKVEE